MIANFDQYGDEKLIEMIVLGNHEAFSVLVKRHVTNSYKTAFRFVRSKEDAEDIVQDCFLKLWKTPQNFNPKYQIKFTSWFSVVIKNCSLDFIKKKSKEQLKEDVDIADDSQNQLQMLEKSYDKKVLKEALDHLQDNQKQAITLFFLENRKHQESAQIMGLSLKAFQSLLMRSKRSLKIFLKTENKGFYEKD